MPPEEWPWWKSALCVLFVLAFWSAVAGVAWLLWSFVRPVFWIGFGVVAGVTVTYLGDHPVAGSGDHAMTKRKLCPKVWQCDKLRDQEKHLKSRSMLLHVCTLEKGHDGRHVCSCGAKHGRTKAPARSLPASEQGEKPETAPARPFADLAVAFARQESRLKAQAWGGVSGGVGRYGGTRQPK